MKKVLLLATVAALATPAFASKARMSALGNSDHLVDPQTAFDNPAHLTLFGDYVTFEAGPTNSGSTVTLGTTTFQDYENGIEPNPQAEGGFLRAMDDTRMGMYFGRKSPFTDSARRAFGFLRQENTLELQYAKKGDMSWGAGFNYSSSDKKSSGKKQSAMGARFGAMSGNWEAFALVGLGSTATGNDLSAIPGSVDANGNGIIDNSAQERTLVSADANSKYTGTTGFKVGGAYKMESLRLFAKMYMDGFKYESTVNTTLNDAKVEASQIDLGAVEVIKHDGGHWFYGAALQNYTGKTTLTAGEQKTTALMLPVWAGIEHAAISWMVVRASVSQNVLLGSRKYDDGSLSAYNDEANTINNNTKVAAGLGLKLGKWDVDGSLAAKTNGNLTANNFMTNVGMTYTF